MPRSKQALALAVKLAVAVRRSVDIPTLSLMSKGNNRDQLPPAIARSLELYMSGYVDYVCGVCGFVERMRGCDVGYGMGVLPYVCCVLE